MLSKIHHSLFIICYISTAYWFSASSVQKPYTLHRGAFEFFRRAERKSYKLDLSLNGDYIIELFSFPDPPKRLSGPEATGLRHLAFEVDDLEAVNTHLEKHHIEVEPIRVDEITNKRFTFASDPDKLPIEFYEKWGLLTTASNNKTFNSRIGQFLSSTPYLYRVADLWLVKW